MKHERIEVALWASRIRLYCQRMAKHLYNHPMLAHPLDRRKRLNSFLDAYAMSMDVYPDRHLPAFPRAADSLWRDFVAVTEDANLVVRKRIKEKDAALIAARRKLLKRKVDG